jgi:hypothetical protein
MKVKTGIRAALGNTRAMNTPSNGAAANAQVIIGQANKAVLSGGGLDIVNQLNIAVGISNAPALAITVNV